MTDWNDAKPSFETDAVAHLVTLMKDDSPHVIPLWVGVDGERLMIFTEIDTLKDRNLRRDPRVAISVTVICLWGTLVGAMLPLVFRRMGFDPAFASSPFVATIVDVTGILIYFTIATIWIPQLSEIAHH